MLLRISFCSGKGPRLVAKPAIFVASLGSGADRWFGDDINCWVLYPNTFRNSKHDDIDLVSFAENQLGNDYGGNCVAARQRRRKDRNPSFDQRTTERAILGTGRGSRNRRADYFRRCRILACRVGSVLNRGWSVGLGRAVVVRRSLDQSRTSRATKLVHIYERTFTSQSASSGLGRARRRTRQLSPC